MKDIKFEDEKLVPPPSRGQDSSKEGRDEKHATAEVKRFPVRMKRGYVPVDPTWEKDPMLGTNKKILMGEEVSLPIEEARRLVKLGAAERADEIDI